MAVDLSEIEAFVCGAGGQQCVVGVLLAGGEWRGHALNVEDQERFRAALEMRERFSNRTLSNWLKSKKIDLGESSVNRHRAGGCRCART